MGYMKRLLFVLVFCMFLSLPGASDSLSDFYHGYSEFATASLFSDPNTGLTLFPTLLVPMGGEYEGMGTAYTAVGRDASFLEANPAASSNLEQTELSLYHTNLIADTSMEGLAYTMRFDDLGLGVGGKHLHVPFTSYDDFGAQIGTARYTETVVAANVSYNFLSSFYFHGVSAGANLKAAYRNIPDRIAPNQSGAGIMTDMGLLSRFHFLNHCLPPGPRVSPIPRFGRLP